MATDPQPPPVAETLIGGGIGAAVVTGARWLIARLWKREEALEARIERLLEERHAGIQSQLDQCQRQHAACEERCRRLEDRVAALEVQFPVAGLDEHRAALDGHRATRPRPATRRKTGGAE